ncbi:MAG: HupE/UreJ family protein [Myxococcales bacterium]|nr:HupE/UreJ family protein [Myxococcales bacterium]
MSAQVGKLPSSVARSVLAAKRTAGLAIVAMAMFVVGFLWASHAEAHTIGLSTGEYTARGASVVGTLAFARAEVGSLVPSIDANRDGHLTPAEVASARSVLKDKVLGRIAVSAGGERCAPVITDVGLMEEDGLLLSGRWDCARTGEPFEVEVGVLDDLARGHRHIARAVTRGATHDEVLHGGERRFTIAPDEDARSPGAAPEAKREASERGTSAWAFFKMGLEHILTGYDHLVFILGLVLVRAHLRSLLVIVTAFTIAHSITLALAVLDVWAPSPQIIEPAIALSIAYVGIENFFVKHASKRWRITFPFGLVHGFGFAGALQEVALPRSAVPTALVSFNLGVEGGQLAVLALLLPLVLFLRGTTWFEPRGARVVSGAVAVAGGVWFVARVVNG